MTFAPIKQEYIISEPKKIDSESGMNFARDFSSLKESNEYNLCHSLSRGEPCTNENCSRGHDIKEYLKTKASDIGEECPVFKRYGKCMYGLRCRFHKHHTNEDGSQIKKETGEEPPKSVPWETIIKLRKKKYEFTRAEEAKKIYKEGPIDNDNVEWKPDHKKEIDWHNKLYLAPLTTVGNLPFRRLCVDLGVDVTCGEMAMADKILQGSPSELALLKRHPSEKLFGVQVCGSNPDLMSRCAEFVSNETEANFIDLNLGCPIDLVFKKGNGSGALGRPKRLQQTLIGMTKSSTIPISVKLRTGIYEGVNIAHEIIPIFKRCGISMVTLHGRTRQQRYTKLADWDYIYECADLAKRLDIPLYGNGDIFSHEQYNSHLLNDRVQGVMIGRPALIKPWIFTEIKEQRYWDITATERLELMKNYCKYGLEHWGSDSEGVNKTRRFFLEWQSFMYRYIPLGLLEHLPQKINDRPPKYRGRNELETLMASDHVDDWIKLSEMLLGPVGDSFRFIPKHKSNSYTTLSVSG